MRPSKGIIIKSKSYKKPVIARQVSLLISLFLFFTFLNISSLIGQSDGEELFQVNCKTCHQMERAVTGPALDGSFERVKEAKGITDEETVDWLKAWIRNSAAVIQSGDEYAAQIYDDYNQTAMNTFITLSDDDLLALIDYIQFWNDTEKYPPEITVGPAIAGKEPASRGISAKTLLLIMVVALFVIALILARVTKVLGRIATEKEGKTPPKEQPFYLNKKFLTLIIMAVVAYGGYRTIDGAISLGRQQGYQPDQPIAFSHKLHAGINKIDCKYCHIGVEKGKQALVPAANICMNCHKYVQEGPTTGTEEIAKIYEAIGYNPKIQVYNPEKTKPIEWVRIHNLPDHVYFNHSQHVKVAKLECQTCHGPIEEMEKVEQFAPLSMGWCLDCHRNTNVQFTSNEYYSYNYEEYHKQLEDRSINGITVEMLGGTECQKCHY